MQLINGKNGENNLTKKTASKTRRDFLEFELEAKYLKIDKLIGQRRHELERIYAVKNLTMPTLMIQELVAVERQLIHLRI